ncbi:hypothetical protein [Aliivibrio fischeri]|uniref:hypothetical protein n=1 Tax=Aliivibrio fischeri TaxID=668 RepID=UPI0012D8D73F|nr:hypothetical protein [Aliivibrio fischeri]MUK28401.1 hypothetical protein [Aliivibrio fischeri]MUK33275.1 hypothetical protein [Aliivibrio fischeri]
MFLNRVVIASMISFVSFSSYANWSIVNVGNELVAFHSPVKNYHQTYTLTINNTGPYLAFNISRFDGFPLECHSNKVTKAVLLLNNVPLNINTQCRGDSFNYFSNDESVNNIVINTFKSSDTVNIKIKGFIDTIKFDSDGFYQTLSRLK